MLGEKAPRETPQIEVICYQKALNYSSFTEISLSVTRKRNRIKQ